MKFKESYDLLVVTFSDEFPNAIITSSDKVSKIQENKLFLRYYISSKKPNKLVIKTYNKQKLKSVGNNQQHFPLKKEIYSILQCY